MITMQKTLFTWKLNIFDMHVVWHSSANSCASLEFDLQRKHMLLFFVSCEKCIGYYSKGLALMVQLACTVSPTMLKSSRTVCSQLDAAVSLYVLVEMFHFSDVLEVQKGPDLTCKAFLYFNTWLHTWDGWCFLFLLSWYLWSVSRLKSEVCQETSLLISACFNCMLYPFC